MSTYEPGRMRDKVTLRRPNQRADSNGELNLHLDSSWTIVDSVWAAITPLRSYEITRARQAQLDTTHKVTIRYLPDLNTTWQIVYDTTEGGRRKFAINGRTDVENRHLYLELTCTESTSA